MGIESLNKDDFARIFAQTNNLSDGRNADGSIYMGPFMGPMEYYLMSGIGLFTIGTQRKQLFTKPTWDGQTVSRWQYGRNMFRANFSSWSNFNNMEFIDTRVQQLEGIINGKTPKLPEDFSGNQAVKDLFKQLSEAKNPREYSQLIQNNKKNYKKLVNILKRTAPEELSKLRILPEYRQMYGHTLSEFQAAQKSIRNFQALPKGRVAALHEMYANARLAENTFINSRGVRSGAGLWTRSNAKMSTGVKNAMATSRTMRTLSRNAGRAGGAACIVLSVANAGMETYSAYAMAKELHPEKAGTIAAKQAGKSVAKAGIELGGAWAGAKLGALAGSWAGPVGAAVGGLIGGFVGWAVGDLIAKKTPVINESETDKMLKEQRVQKNEQITQAIENDNIDVLAENLYQFYELEEVKDEQGNASIQLKTDKNGEPIIRTVSDDKKQQLAFEQKVKSLTNYVETETAKLERAQELQRQLPAEMTDAEKLYYAQQYGIIPAERPSFDKEAYLAQFKTGFDAGYASTPASYSTASWTNPAWQDSLGQRFDSQNFFAFDPMNYSSYMMYPQYQKAS